MDKSRLNLINTIISATLILCIGLAIGYAAGYFYAAQASFPEIKPISETNPGIATVKFIEVKNGQLVGKITGQRTRLAWNPDGIIDLDAESEFKIPLSQINLKDYYAADSLPPDVQFVASSKGKYYYSVFEKTAWNISPSNRIYFSSRVEAEKSGYLKK